VSENDQQQEEGGFNLMGMFMPILMIFGAIAAFFTLIMPNLGNIGNMLGGLFNSAKNTVTGGGAEQSNGNAQPTNNQTMEKRTAPAQPSALPSPVTPATGQKPAASATPAK
jgi:hypothetical protein